MINFLKSKTAKAAVGLIAIAIFFSASVASAYTFVAPTMKVGSKGAQVVELQKVLNAGGYGTLTEDGNFGPMTKAAVIKWQKAVGLTGDGVVGPMSREKLNGTTPSNPNVSLCPNGMTLASNCTMPPSGGTQTGPVMAMLSTTNPASSTLVAGQATADLAHFTFSGTGTVTNVTLKRIGVSSDSTPSNVYLFDGAMRLTDASSVSNNGMISFDIPAGIFMVNGTKTISVKSDIASGTSGQTVGVMLQSFMTSGATAAVNANLSGNIHSIASATLATVAAGTVTPSGATLNPGSGVTVWQSTLTVGNRDVWVKRFALRNVGSAPASAFQNFKLFVNGTQVATAAGMDAMGYVTFDLSTAPVSLMSGSRVVRVDADIVSGASRSVRFSLRQAADVDFVDSSFGVNVSPTSTPWVAGADSTISGASGGTLTIEKDITSPTGNVSEGTNDKTLGIFKVTAFGEPMKIENLRATYTSSDASVGTLRNGRILIGGVQYGSTASLAEDSQGTPYTQYTTNYTVYPGTPVMVELRADMYDNDGTDNLSNGDTIIGVIAAGSSNVMKVDSLGSVSSPSSAVSANTLTLADASATLTKNATYANQTVALPATNFKVGSWNLAGSSTEDILLSTLSFDVDEVTVSADDFNESDMTNMYVVVKNGGTTVAQPSPLATVSAADNNFSINYTLMKNSTVTIELYANLGSTVTAAEKVKTDLTVTGTAMVSGSAVTATSADTEGQTLTAGTASITVSKDASSPVAAIAYDNQTVTTLALNFASLTASYDITDMTVTVGSSANTVINSVDLYDGATLVKSVSMTTSTTAVFNNILVNVPANTNTKVLTVKLQLGAVGVGAGTTGATITTSIAAATDIVYTNKSTGVSTSTTTEEAGTATGSAMYAYAATPTITNIALPSSTLSTGTQTVSKFKIDANGGTVGWKKIIFTVTRAIGGTDTLSNTALYDYDTNTAIAGAVTYSGSVEADGGTSGTIIFIATNEEQVSGTKTYVLKTDIAGTLATGNNINVSIAQPTAHAAPAAYATVAATTSSFSWTDRSATSHSATTLDWNNDNLVKNLPTDTQTLIYN